MKIKEKFTSQNLKKQNLGCDIWTTELKGKDTFFLPFNKSLRNEETQSDGYKVDYLWKEILTPTSLLDILENFVLFTEVSDFEWSDEKKKVIEKKKNSSGIIWHGTSKQAAYQVAYRNSRKLSLPLYDTVYRPEIDKNGVKHIIPVGNELLEATN
mgnify:CR=1 FL=1